MGDAGNALAAPVAIVSAFARGMECLPGNPGRVVDPRLFRLGVAARRLTLLDDVAAGLAQPSIDLVQFVLVFNLDAEVIEPRLTPAGRDPEIHARIVKHPFGVIGLGHRGLCRKKRRIEADGALQIMDGDMDMQAFHDRLRQAVALARFARASLQDAGIAHASRAPWQQLSVR